MNPADFVHLHVHTQYSLLDGASRIPDLINRAVELKMPALAITDHGNMHGVIKFYQAALSAGIKPILGSELYVAPGNRRDKGPGSAKHFYHMTLLARDETGYENLLELSSRGYLEGFYYKPRIDRELLELRHQGLIALSGCLKGEIPQALLAGDEKKARQLASYYQEMFGEDNFYLELQDHNIPDQKTVNQGLIRIARSLNIPLVAANDCHYVFRQDAFAQEVLLCIQTGAKLSDEKRMKMTGSEFYLKSAAEMFEIFHEIPDSLRNTREIADRCHVDLEFGRDLLPQFPTPPGKDAKTYLSELCREGIPNRYENFNQDSEDRLKHELKVIHQKGFDSYFLIVWDLIHYAKSHRIPVGPGRGSAAGSLVAYLLGITDIDPFRHALLFERFLNPERMALPDIDMDICDRRRGELIQYASQKYGGDDHVAQIITFGSMKSRAVLRDVGRVLDIPYAEVDRIAKLVPEGPRMTLKQALKLEPRLREISEQDEVMKRLFEVSFRLEGISRNASTHAAGVIICQEPLTKYVPLCRGRNGEVVTQFDMHDDEGIGLLKMDFLGLKTLSIIQDTLEMVEATEGIKIELDKIPLDDPDTYKQLSLGNTIGVFQLESSGMRDLSRRFGIKDLDDILALIALYRPGPMHMLEDFIARKQGKVKIEYAHPELESVLKGTYGVMLYQEQVMQIAHRFAGFTLAKADTLRKAMGKKQVDKMAQLRDDFSRGAVERGFKREVAENIFSDMARFAEYGFNKSHSAAYALIAYRTAYLKTRYPRQYMAAVLTSEINDTDKLAFYMGECREMEIEVLAPDINESFSTFTVVEGGIRFGLSAIKNVGQGAVAALIQARQEGGKYASLFDLLERVNLKALNKRVVESLIRCGTMDSLEGSRAQKLEVLDASMSAAARAAHDRDRGQATLFEQLAASSGKENLIHFPPIEEFPEAELLAGEKELLGMYVTGHPLEKYSRLMGVLVSAPLKDLDKFKSDSQVRVGGLITQVEQRISRKSGKPFAVCRLEDLESGIDLLVFNQDFSRLIPSLEEGNIVVVEGRVRSGELGPSISAFEVTPVDQALEKLSSGIHLEIFMDRSSGETLHQLDNLLSRHPGPCPIFLDLHSASGSTVVIKGGRKRSITCSPRLVVEIERILGPGTVKA